MRKAQSSSNILEPDDTLSICPRHDSIIKEQLWKDEVPYLGLRVEAKMLLVTLITSNTE
jgi:hypothetical protein